MLKQQILTNSHRITPMRLADYTKVEYQTKPAYVREVLYDNLRENSNAKGGRSSSLAQKKNLLRAKRAMGHDSDK